MVQQFRRIVVSTLIFQSGKISDQEVGQVDIQAETPNITSQAARQRKPCVNGDTSFLWESETFWLFFPLGSGGQTPQRTFTQNGSNNVFSRKDVPFAVKVATFHTPWSPGPLKGQNFANFWTEIFRSIWPLTLEVRERTPLILYRSSMKVA